MASSTAYVSPDYFHALRIPILAGRTFTDSDTSTSESVAMVNVSFAKKHMGTLDVIGFHLGLGGKRCTIVGLVGDVKKRPGIHANAPLSTEPMYYVPFTQVDQAYLKLVHVWFQPSWVVRTNAPIIGLPEAMQKALSASAPSLPFSGFYRLGDLQELALSEQRVQVFLLSTLAALALLLSIVGVYGLVANAVAQRRREIGIRMALGSTLPRAMRNVAGSGMMAVLLGLSAGLILATFVLGIMRNQLYGVRSLDPATLIAVSVFLFSAALLASFAPTLRIASIDPASTLRAE
jgi:predicted lysophospholipase L1 biosynthesis ABC-type transport system permease subunit